MTRATHLLTLLLLNFVVLSFPQNTSAETFSTENCHVPEDAEEAGVTAIWHPGGRWTNSLDDRCQIRWNGNLSKAHHWIRVIDVIDGDPLYVAGTGRAQYVGLGKKEHGPVKRVRTDEHTYPDFMLVLGSSLTVTVVDGKPLFAAELFSGGEAVFWGEDVGPAFYHINAAEGLRIENGQPLYTGIHLLGSEEGYRAVWGNVISDPHWAANRVKIVDQKLAYVSLDEPWVFASQSVVWGNVTSKVWNGAPFIDGMRDGELAYQVELWTDPYTWRGKIIDASLSP